MELVGCRGCGVHLALNHYSGPKSLQPVSWAWSPNQAPVLLLRVGSGKGVVRSVVVEKYFFFFENSPFFIFNCSRFTILY